MGLKGKHVAVLAEDLYGDPGLWYPVVRFREAGAKVTEDREVVRDGNLVTSRKPEDLPSFCRTILQALSEAKTQRHAPFPFPSTPRTRRRRDR